MGGLAALDEARRRSAGGGDHPPDPQAGRDRLRRGAEVGDPAPVEGGERRHRRDVVPELGVVVVLDHDGVARARAAASSASRSVGRHDVAERVLVGGRDVGGRQSGQVRDRRQRREVDDVAARDAGPSRPRPGSRGPRRRPRPGGRRRSSWRRPSVVPVVTSDLVGSTAQAAGAGEPLGERLAELGDAARVGVARAAGSRPTPRATPAATRRRAAGRSRACRCRGGPGSGVRVRCGGVGAGTGREACPTRRTSRRPARRRASPRRAAGRRPARPPTRATPRSAASARVLGSRSPRRRVPARTRSRTRPASWTPSGRRARRGRG